LEREVAAVDLFRSLEGSPALLRACDIIDDVMELVNCDLFAPDFEGIVIAGFPGFFCNEAEAEPKSKALTMRLTM
jgi:hypothetical protein